MEISVVPIIIAAGGVAIIAWIYFWSRQRGQLGHIPTIEEPPQELTLAANEDAILVSTERGQVIYANESARRWLGMNGGDPDLEYIVQLAQPTDSLLELFAAEGQASFQLGKRWVEASSHLVPAGNERRMVIRMRELSAAASHPEALNLNAAMAVINEIGQTANASMGIEQVLQILLTIVSKAVPADAGEICLWEEKEQALYQRGWIGDTSYLLAMAELGGIYHQDEGLPGWMAHYRKPILLTRSDDRDAESEHHLQSVQQRGGRPTGARRAFIGTLSFSARSVSVSPRLTWRSFRRSAHPSPSRSTTPSFTANRCSGSTTSPRSSRSRSPRLPRRMRPHRSIGRSTNALRL
jgi:hypothetical protein